VIRPEDESYETARLVHNRTIDRHPSLIIKAANATDVARTVVFARDAGLELAVRGGSHSLAGYGTTEGGIVLDLSGMKGLHIDPERRLAWAQAGLTAGEYTAAAGAHGLATPFGDTGSVGLSGLTPVGGIGWLVRKHGLAIDALVSVDVVTADGRLITASEEDARGRREAESGRASFVVPRHARRRGDRCHPRAHRRGVLAGDDDPDPDPWWGHGPRAGR
jgi:FAD/FMN-containing dehydrogenase